MSLEKLRLLLPIPTAFTYNAVRCETKALGVDLLMLKISILYQLQIFFEGMICKLSFLDCTFVHLKKH
jgi:hypothetical protein